MTARFLFSLPILDLDDHLGLIPVVAKDAAAVPGQNCEDEPVLVVPGTADSETTVVVMSWSRC